MVRPKFVKIIQKDGRAKVGERAQMLMVAPTNWAPMHHNGGVCNNMKWALSAPLPFVCGNMALISLD